jgi:ATP-dependent helicase Lhr and Lhr-like helicase
MFPFQQECRDLVLDQRDGLLNAPTGSGKTLALWMPFALMALREKSMEPSVAPAGLRSEATETQDVTSTKSKPRPRTRKTTSAPKKNGIRLLWLTPLRALARDTERSMQVLADDLGIDWQIARRTGDNTAAERRRFRKQLPEVLIITPESLHVLLSMADHPQYFEHLEGVVVDEWHELMGTKRGVQAELAIAWLRTVCPSFVLWGISATIGNMDDAVRSLGLAADASIVKADIKKAFTSTTLLPETVDRFPWAGHIGLKLAERIVEIVRKSTSVLMFTNTRSMTEIWYQHLLELAPDLAGRMAIHHGSLGDQMRGWVEQALHDGLLKLVICTSSLDLGVDFAPVETVIQVGSPKGVARYLQRAGRSGHRPGAESRIYFLPTHALEILDALALQKAAESGRIESRHLSEKPLDVLVQFVCTLACGTGCTPERVLKALQGTHTYRNLSNAEWQWVLLFVTNGGRVLQGYDDYNRVVVAENGDLHIVDKKQVMRHRLSIGTITSDANLPVKYMKGGRIGTVEESFIARLRPGDVFLFAGRYLEFVRLRDHQVLVRNTSVRKGVVSRWMGGRMPLSSQLAGEIRTLLSHPLDNTPEGQALAPLMQTQSERSEIPSDAHLLIEQLRTREGWHHFLYPLDGRQVHEALASVLAWRIGERIPITFSIAVNDYGLELLSDQPIPEKILLDHALFSPEGLEEAVMAGINASEMAKRQFREIARVAGLVFHGWPGQRKQFKHLQASSSLLFDVFSQYEPDNLLVQQAYQEIMHFQIEQDRLKNTLMRIQKSPIRLVCPDRFTPFSFPIMVDRLRARLSSEKLEDRIRKMYTKLTE